MISVKRSESCGATRCHITWVSEKPCSNSNGGPLPPTRAKMRPDLVLIHSAAKPGKRSARSDMGPLNSLSAALLLRPLPFHRLPADVAAAETIGPFDPVDRGIGARLSFSHRLARRADVKHAPAVGENLAVACDRAGVKDLD